MWWGPSQSKIQPGFGSSHGIFLIRVAEAVHVRDEPVAVLANDAVALGAGLGRKRERRQQGERRGEQTRGRAPRAGRARDAEGPARGSGRGRTAPVPAWQALRRAAAPPAGCGRCGWRGAHAGAPARSGRTDGALALWRSGALALWRSGALALWRSGALALWRSGALALWRSGALALWRSGALALWRSIVSSGRFRTVNLFPYSVAMGAPPDRQRAHAPRLLLRAGPEPARIVPFFRRMSVKCAC